MNAELEKSINNIQETYGKSEDFRKTVQFLEGGKFEEAAKLLRERGENFIAVLKRMERAQQVPKGQVAAFENFFNNAAKFLALSDNVERYYAGTSRKARKVFLTKKGREKATSIATVEFLGGKESANMFNDLIKAYNIPSFKKDEKINKLVEAQHKLFLAWKGAVYKAKKTGFFSKEWYKYRYNQMIMDALNELKEAQTGITKVLPITSIKKRIEDSIITSAELNAILGKNVNYIAALQNLVTETFVQRAKKMPTATSGIAALMFLGMYAVSFITAVLALLYAMTSGATVPVADISPIAVAGGYVVSVILAGIFSWASGRVLVENL